MKRLNSFFLFLALLLGLGFNASALKVTLEWDIPGSIELIAEDNSKYNVELTPGQTSYTWETDKSYGYVYAYAAEGFRLVGAESTDGSKKYNVTGTPPRISMGFYSGDNGLTVKITTAQLYRNDSFTVDVVNGLSNIRSAEFNSGYTLDLQKGSHIYKFNEEYDDPLQITLQSVEQAYSITLNGTELEKNKYYASYEDIEVKNGDKLVIQVFESSDQEPIDCTLTIEYGNSMEGCIENIRNASADKWYYPEDFDSKGIEVLENTKLRVNFNPEDYTIEKLTLNGKDITRDMVTSTFNGSQYVEITVTEPSSVLKVEGTAKVFGTIDFTGYIINTEGVAFSKTYHGTPFELPEGEEVTDDIKLTSSLIMPASETLKYVIPMSEKSPKFFFYPKEGYYIENVYTLTPEGKIEQHSGNASMTATIDGTTFYMIVKKLPSPYQANLKIVGKDLFLRIQSSSGAGSAWDNPSPSAFSAEEGEREISFLPGFGTPIIFAFSSSDAGTPALYLDGAEVAGIENSESGGLDFSVTPYYPTEENDNKDIESSIEVYNSFTQRPTMSGASLELVGEGQAEFFYSPVLHPADPKGQVVIAGTQFTVRPADPRMEVSYKGERVELNEDGEFVFEAKGNARNNVVKVGDINNGSNVEVIETVVDDPITVITLDGKVLLENAPKSRLVEIQKGFYLVNGKKKIVE